MFAPSRRDVRPSLLLLAALAQLCSPVASSAAAEPTPPQLLLPLGHGSDILSVALSRDGKRALTGSVDKTAILWNTETGKPLQTFKGHTNTVFSVALSGDGRRALTGSKDRTAMLWDVQSGKLLQTFKGHTSDVNAVALSRDGKRALTGSDDRTAMLWDTATGKRLQTFKGHTSNVCSVALSRDGKRALTGSWDKTAILWNTETGELLQTFKGHTSYLNSVALSGDGKRALTGSDDKIAILWDAGTGKPLQTFKGHTGTIKSVALSGDGKRVLTGSKDTTAIFWDGQSGKPLQTFKGHYYEVRSVALSDDGKRALTGPWDSTAFLWETETGKRLQTFKGATDSIRSVALSRDGKRAFTGSVEKTAILWDTETAKPLRTFKGHTSNVCSAALSRDGKRALTGSWDKTAILWNTETGELLQTFKGHTSYLNSVALSGDGRRALTGSDDKIAMLWDAGTGKPLQTFKGHTDRVTSVALSGDGKRAFTGSRDRTAMLWDTETGKRLQTFEGHTASVESVALSRDGKRALTGSNDRTAMLWDTATGKPLQTFKEQHGSPIWDAAFAPRNDFMITASRNGTLCIWKPGCEEPVLSFLSAGEEWIFWTLEGYYTCSPNGESLIAWKIKDDSTQGFRIVGPEQFRKQFYRPDLFRHLLTELDLAKALALADKESRRPSIPATTIARILPPVVLVTRPERDGDIDTEQVTVEAVAVSVGEHPVTRMRLQINGRDHGGNRSAFNVPTPKLGKVRRTWKVDLEPGQEVTIQVFADSAVSFGRSDVLRIRRKARKETLPRLFVLAIGVTAYEKESLRKGVYYSAADARKFGDTVETSSKPLYREIKVIRLLDRDATRTKILRALTQLSKQATQNDAVMIFFAGHGKRDDQNNFYFLPAEADLDDLAATGLSEGDFKARVRAVAGRVILFLDACHSGALIENDRRSGDGPTDQLYRDLTSGEKGLVVMCSSKGVEVSRESNEHRSGLFTLALVEGLKGKARKTGAGAVYSKALDDYVTERVKVLSEGRQHPLTSKDTTITNIPLTRP